MIVVVILFFLAYTLAISIVVSLGFSMQRKKESSFYGGKDGVHLSDITVLIPFRNEEHRLNGLLDSINQSEVLPKQFIFIDDHSTDKSVFIISQKIKNTKVEILSLPDEITGKKKALRFAIERVKTKYILTLDADVNFNSTYFESLSKLEDADMYILPVLMEPKKSLEYFYEIDFVLVNAINTGLAGLKRPIICSGANLLYKKDIFEEVDNLSSHVHVASGDDTYLLRDFRESDKEVRLISNYFCAVRTETPQSFKEFIDQRLRWIGKTGDLKDNLSTGLVIVQSLLTSFFLGLLIYTSITYKWKLFAVLFIVKSMIDLVVFASFFSSIQRRITWLLIPVYELLFPIYTIIILVLYFTYHPQWKGRKIYSRKDK